MLRPVASSRVKRHNYRMLSRNILCPGSLLGGGENVEMRLEVERFAVETFVM
jgi:hypothetical protein